MTKTDVTLVHSLGPEAGKYGIPDRFTYPFRYTPAPVTMLAAGMVLEHISACDELQAAFSEGKMLGVLVVRGQDGSTGFLAGFSGLAGGKSILPYFVPPILDITDPHGYFKKKEAEISRLNDEVMLQESSPETAAALRAIESAESEAGKAVSQWKERMKASKARRDGIRERGADGTTLAALIRESQFEKAQLKRLVAEGRAAIDTARQAYFPLGERISKMKRSRQEMSEALQKWIFENMIVENALGERKSIWRIFSEAGLVPPGGTGECAAPKLLHYAYAHGLEPVAMGEFWYGKDHGVEVRQHGRFYPACKGKCGPLLGFMLKGLDMGTGDSGAEKSEAVPYIIYEDSDIIAADKPSGMLSVPGKTGGKSLQEMLSERLGIPVLCVHRLDMDTSGVIVYAKNPDTQKNLQRQFETGEVMKEYTALLDTGRQFLNADSGRNGKLQEGRISLPVAPDYHDRPRQKIDFENGKEAVTEYSILETGDGWTRVLFRPLTGRTHQLRIHAAHPMGLGAPIKGDRLYGSAASAGRLCLHASLIKFRHPATGLTVELESFPAF